MLAKLVSLLTLGVLIFQVQARLDGCKMPIEPGMCMAYFPSWGFDAKRGRCIEFVYGGCGGNLNRFHSEERCERACGRRKAIQPLQADRCLMPIKAGRCRAYNPAWAFDVKKDACVEFIYGGCDGNLNRFESKEQCERSCPGYL